MGAPARETAAWTTAASAAKAFGVSTVTVYRLLHAGGIPGHKAITGIRIPADFVADAVDAIRSGRAIDLGEFARQWMAAQGEAQVGVMIPAPASKSAPGAVNTGSAARSQTLAKEELR